jgi:hypothetical protein
MTSLRRRYANRLNARTSTGPRTAAGKARAAQNARKHGLRVPALRDPEKTRNIAELARKLAGRSADAQRFEAACRLVAAQIDLLDIREARLPLLSRVLVDDTALKRLTTLDLYERNARSQRKSAAREFGSMCPPVGAGGRQTAGTDTCGNEIDLAAVLQKPSMRRLRTKPARGAYLRFGKRRDATRA